MNLRLTSSRGARERGSVFILVLWISFGLVVLALYFANSMNFELRAADNRVATIEAEHAISGAARYTSYVLTEYATNGAVPDLRYYSSKAVPVGDAIFWLLGRGEEQSQGLSTPTVPMFGLVDESSKLNLNSTNVTATMLASLPGMTLELADAIIDWRDADGEVSEYGAEDEIYQRLLPPRRCKNGPFESVEELRLVFGATLDILYGEDVNRNGLLDANENDGDISPPSDNRDGRLYRGILDYMTIYSREPDADSDGVQRIVVTNGVALRSLLTTNFPNKTFNIPPTGYRSVLEFESAIGDDLTANEIAGIEGSLRNVNLDGLVNVNTASEAVLACIPGISNSATALVAFRQSNPDRLTSMTWLKDVVDETAIQQAGPYLTGRAYQFTADIVALGHHDRGYQRVKFVFDTTEDAPKILYRQDLSALGWALGRQVREDLQLAKALRR